MKDATKLVTYRVAKYIDKAKLPMSSQDILNAVLPGSTRTALNTVLRYLVAIGAVQVTERRVLARGVSFFYSSEGTATAVYLADHAAHMALPVAQRKARTAAILDTHRKRVVEAKLVPTKAEPVKDRRTLILGALSSHPLYACRAGFKPAVQSLN